MSTHGRWSRLQRMGMGRACCAGLSSLATNCFGAMFVLVSRVSPLPFHSPPCRFNNMFAGSLDRVSFGLSHGRVDQGEAWWFVVGAQPPKPIVTSFHVSLVHSSAIQFASGLHMRHFGKQLLSQLCQSGWPRVLHTTGGVCSLYFDE